MAIKRMKSGFYIGSDEFGGITDFDSEMEVSTEIFQRLAERSYFKVSQEEILNLAIYIKVKVIMK